MAPAAQETVHDPYPLYNTTFTLHRVSSLYTGVNHPLNNAALQQHAKRFRDILAGDVLRGVRIGLGSEDEALARVGALQSVTWQVLAGEDLWDVDEESRMDSSMDHGAGNGNGNGILVQISYEKMAYRALLLRKDREKGQDEIDGQKESFQHFPLLLTRMPAPLRETFADFLTTTFDARVAVLHLSSPYLTTAFEKYISDCCIDEDGEALDPIQLSSVLRKIVKDVQVLIGFDLPTTSLQTMEFHIAQEDIPRLVQRGKKVGDGESPFMNALESFVRAHLALDIKHVKVRILRIACGAFVLGAEGRVKLTEPGVDAVQMRSTWNLVDGLVGIANGGKISIGNVGT